MNFDTSNHPDTSDDTVEELEQRAEHARARVDDTISEIKEASSTDQIVEQVVSALSGGPGDFLRNLGRTVKDNPVPTALLAISAVWLASSTQSEGDDDEFDSEEDADSAQFARTRPTGAYPPSPPLGSSVDTASAFRASSPDASVADEGKGDGDGVIKKVTEKAEELKSEVSSLRDRAAQRLEEGRDEGAARLDAAKDEAARRMAAASKKVRRGARQAKGNFMQQLNENPMVLAGIGIALGAAMGAAIPNTRKEDELLGDQAEKLREQAKQAAMPLVEGAEQRAHEVLDQAKSVKNDLMQAEGESAAELAKGKVSEGGEQVEQKSEQVADQVRSKVKDVAARAEDWVAEDAGADPGSVKDRS